MPRPVGYGRPGTKAIPDGWQDNAARVIAGTLDCTVVIRPPGVAPTFNTDRRQTETAEAPPTYTGPAAITPIEDTSSQPVIADDVVPVRRYEVKLLHAATGVNVDQVVTVTVAPDDAELQDRHLKVTTVEVGSRRFSRILQAVLTD